MTGTTETPPITETPRSALIPQPSALSPDLKGILLVLLSAAAFGLMPIFARLAYEQMNFPQPERVKTLLVIRFCLASVCMWVAVALVRRAAGSVPMRLRPSNLLPLILLGALGYVGQSFSYFTALTTISASTTGLFLYTYPILVTLLAWIFFRERLDRRKLVALAVAILGALMVLGLFSSILGGGEPLGALNPVGVAWGLAAATIYSLYIIAGTRFTAGFHPIFSSAVIITSAACVYTPWSLLAHELHLDMSPEAWLWVVAIALVSTALAIVAFFAGLVLVGPSRAAIASAVEPAVTVGLAALILQERITLEQLLGGALVLSSVVILQARSRKT